MLEENAQPARSAGSPAHCPELAAIVLALGAPASVIDSVRSLLRQDPPVEIVVVNSGGGDVGAC